MDIATLAKLLGHANLRSVMRYIHISQDHMDQAVLRYGEPAGQENRRPAECEQTRYGTATKGGAVQ
jgi:hypothetical protein